MISVERQNNLIWTTAEKYDFIPNPNMFDTSDFYTLALVGYFYKTYDMNLVDAFVKTQIYSKNNAKELLMILRIVLENNCYTELLKDRPGLVSIRKEYIDRVLKKYYSNDNRSLDKAIENSYYTQLQGGVVKEAQNIVSLLEDIFKIQTKITKEILVEIISLFEKYFKIYFSDLYEEKESSSDNKDKKQKKSKTKTKAQNQSPSKLNLDELEKYLIQSAEFTFDYGDYEVTESEDSVSVKQSIDRSEIILNHYGQSYKNPNETSRLEDFLCTGLHSGIHLHFSHDNFLSDFKSEYYRARIEEQRKINLEFYQKNKHFFKRSERNLREIILNTLLKNTLVTKDYSNYGKIEPSRIWKTKFGQQKIFTKKNKSHEGDLSVVILLDASASQYIRQSQVATQAYIITNALVGLNVPTEVYYYNNLFNYLILNRLRSFSDPISKNEDIMSYTAAGSNRDGLAIKVMANYMESLDTSKKLLIVLSDGKPHDEVNMNFLEASEAQNYMGEEALVDSAKEVLNGKLKGIDILGIFTGEYEDIQQEKIIFGNNFAYINDIMKFHEIVGFYFKTISNS